MKKASKPVPQTPAKKAPAAKPAAVTPKPKSAAKPKAKPSSKPKPRESQDQLELFPILKRLAMAAERLADATAWNAQRREQPPDTFKTLSESIADSTAAEEHPQTAAPPDLAISGEHSETTDLADLTASGESAETVDDTQAETTDNPHKNDE